MSFIKIKISKWEQMININDVVRAGGWCFRGHSNSLWSLNTTFERYFYSYGDNARDIGQIEDKIIEGFDSLNRKHPPMVGGPLDSLSKMSYMQHNGCATRLLDITYDFYNACFFAAFNSGLSAQDSQACIWCFRLKNIHDHISNAGMLHVYENESSFKVALHALDNMFCIKDNSVNSSQDGVLLINNIIDSDHQVEQGGGFLMAMNPKKTTHDQLMSIYGVNNDVFIQDKVNYADELFFDVEQYDIMQLIIESRDLLRDCEWRISKDHGRTLARLFVNGVNSRLANLNDIIKFHIEHRVKKN